MSLLVNLFDCSIVLALAFLVAFVAQSKAAKAAGDPAAARRPGQGEDDVNPTARVGVDRFRPSPQRIGGEGTRLGTACRLPTGEIVYVPDPSETAAPSR